MADGSFATKISADRDDNTLANPILVQLSDGSAAIGVTSSALDVNIASGSLSLAASYADDSAFTVGTSEVLANGGIVTADTVDSGDVGAFRMLANRAQVVTLEDAGGDGISVDGSGNLVTISAANDGVDIGDVDVTSVVPGTAATNLGKAIDSAAGGTDTGVASLAVRDDALTTLTPVDGDYVPLRTDSEGALWVALSGSSTLNNDSIHVDDAAFTVATDSITAIGAIATADSVDSGDVGALRMLTNRALVTTLEDAGGDGIAIDASGNLAVDLPDNTETNPVFVQTVNTSVSASEIHDYDTTASLASDTADNHDYTVTGTTLLLKRVSFASSGGMKIEVQTGPLASLATVAVGFVPRHGGKDYIEFCPPVEVPATGTGTVRVIRTNRQGSAQDVYSTIMGNDV